VTNTRENNVTTAIATLPPVVCTAWCTDGTGHADSLDSDEQFCRSAARAVQLTHGRLGERPRSLLVHLYRDAHADDGGETRLEPAHLEIAGFDLDTLRLSVDEARALSQTLRELADVAEHWQ
jgi:hypothetical protein